MTDIEQRLLSALVQLDESVSAVRNPGAKPNLLPLFTEIDDLARQLPPGTDPELLHFLHRKSYAKARALLESKP